MIDEQTGPPDFTAALPASFGQQRLWFLSNADPHAHLAYHMLGGVRVHGRLDLDRLEEAIGAVVQRHEVLRTTFRHHAGELWQVAHPRLSFSLTRADHRDAAAATVDEAIAAEAGRPFDLAAGPLIRATAITSGPELHTLILALHHAICDGWSLAILLGEITAHYRALSAGQLSDLPPLPIQYADYAVWQRNRLTSGALDGQISYWRTQLADLPALPLPAGNHAASSFAGGRLHRRLGPALTADLTALVRAEGTTPHAGLIAAVTTLLRGLTGVADVPVGTAVAGRHHVDVERLVGFFVNTLVIRTDHTGDPTFRQLLGRVGDTCLDAYANQDVPFERLVAELRPRRSPSGNPFFHVMVTLQNQPAAVLDLPGLRFEALPPMARFSPFPLDFVFRETGVDGLSCDLDYHTATFAPELVERMWEVFATLLAAAVANPDQPLTELLPDLLLADQIAAAEPAPSPVRLPAAAALREHPLVDDAVVVLREDVLTAYVTGTASPDELLAHLAERLPGADLPVVVELDVLPRTATGDVDLDALPAPYAEPRTELESTIAGQWRELLRTAEPIGIHDDFFDLGGHSLLAVRAMAELGDTLGVELPVNLILESPTIARLSVHLGTVEYRPAAEIKRLPRVLGGTR